MHICSIIFVTNRLSELFNLILAFILVHFAIWKYVNKYRTYTFFSRFRKSTSRWTSFSSLKKSKKTQANDAIRLKICLQLRSLWWAAKLNVNLLSFWKCFSNHVTGVDAEISGGNDKKYIYYILYLRSFLVKVCWWTTLIYRVSIGKPIQKHNVC